MYHETNNYPRIKSYYTVVVHSEDYVELKHGIWNTISHYLNDDKKKGILGKVILAINGKLSSADISKHYDIARSDLEALLDQLNSIDALDFGPSSMFDCYLDNAVPTLKRSYFQQQPFQMNRPLLLIGDDLLTIKLQTILTDSFSNQIRIERIDEEIYQQLSLGNDKWLYDPLLLEEKLAFFSKWKDFFIVLATKHVNPDLASKINRLAYQLDIPWLHVTLDGPFLFVGPLFSGTAGPCYDCFEQRIAMNLRNYKNYLDYKQALINGHVKHHESESYEHLVSHLACSYAAMEITNYLLTECSFVKNKVFSIYLPSMEIAYSDVLRLSNCVTCGGILKREEHQLYFDYESLLTKETTREC